MSKKHICLTILVVVLMVVLGVSNKFQKVEAEPITIIVPDTYERIQWAASNASNGDTIFVRSGAYYEHVIIDKSISLMGEDRYTTIVDGEGTGSVICTTADNVTITGFTIQNSGRTISGAVPDAGISVSHVNNCNISGNSLTDNYVGIFVRPSTRAWFANNVITRNHIGIDINNQSTYNIISGNILQKTMPASMSTTQISICFLRIT